MTTILQPESKWRVSLEGSRVIVVEPDGTRMEADFEDLQLVKIVTNDTGPWGADVWWAFEGAGEIILCAWPQGASGEQPVIDWTMGLSGFDHEAMIGAMSSVENANFIVWRRA